MPCNGLHALLPRNWKDLATGSRLFLNYCAKIMIVLHFPQGCGRLNLYNPKIVYALFIVQEKRIFGRQKISSVQGTFRSCSLDNEASFGENINPPHANGHEPNLLELG